MRVDKQMLSSGAFSLSFNWAGGVEFCRNLTRYHLILDRATFVEAAQRPKAHTRANLDANATTHIPAASNKLRKTAALPRSLARPDNSCHSGPIRSTVASMAVFKSSTIITSHKAPASTAISTQVRPSQALATTPQLEVPRIEKLDFFSHDASLRPRSRWRAASGSGRVESSGDW